MPRVDRATLIWRPEPDCIFVSPILLSVSPPSGSEELWGEPVTEAGQVVGNLWGEPVTEAAQGLEELWGESVTLAGPGVVGLWGDLVTDAGPGAAPQPQPANTGYDARQSVQVQIYRLCKPLSDSPDLTLSDYPAGNPEYVQTTP